MHWLAAVAAIAGASGALVQRPAAVEVMVVGTYHMDNPGRDLANMKADDVLKPGRQKELEALSAALADFRPTMIVVERTARTPELLDHRYAEFTSRDLGKSRDERYQIAYRLAHRLRHKQVYAIDEGSGPGEPDYFPFDKVMAWAKANGAEDRLNASLDQVKAEVARTSDLQSKGSVSDVLLDLNRPDRIKLDQGWYYGMLSYGDTESQPGADLNAMWYLRNAKIFGKLKTVVKPGDRVLVVYGSGHNYWLRHFAETTPGFRNVDPTPFLARAAKVRR